MAMTKEEKQTEGQIEIEIRGKENTKNQKQTGETPDKQSLVGVMFKIIQ